MTLPCGKVLKDWLTRASFAAHKGAILKGGMWGRYYISCFGSIIVEEIATGEVVCTAIIKDEEGDRDLVIEDRLAKCFNALGKAITKMK